MWKPIILLRTTIKNGHNVLKFLEGTGDFIRLLRIRLS